jgi:hypothetical protein
MAKRRTGKKASRNSVKSTGRDGKARKTAVAVAGKKQAGRPSTGRTEDRASRSGLTHAKRGASKKSRSSGAAKVVSVPLTVPAHVLIRVRSEDGATISEHYRVLQEQGRALIGKVGKALGDGFMEQLNRQIASGTETYLFLTTKNGWRGSIYTTYQCGLEAVHNTLLPGKRDLVPDYYAAEYEGIGTWFEITSMYELERDEMNRIEVVSSGRTIMSVIKSMASVFKVRVP